MTEWVYGYQAFLHWPVEGEPWTNDAWIVPIMFSEENEDDLLSSPVEAFFDYQPEAIVCNGYEPRFVGVGGFYRETRHGFVSQELEWYRNAEIAGLKRRRSFGPGPWVDGDIRVVQATLSPLWRLTDDNEALNQGIDPRTVPVSFDPGEILNMPGSDFQGIHLQPDRTTPRVLIELTQGLVALRSLAAYRDSLRRGRVRMAWALWSSTDVNVPDDELSRIRQQLIMGRNLDGEDVADDAIRSITFDKPQELPLTYPEAERLLTEASINGGNPWPVIDSSPARNVAMPRGTVFPEDWAPPKPKGY